MLEDLFTEDEDPRGFVTLDDGCAIFKESLQPACAAALLERCGAVCHVRTTIPL